MACFAAKVWMFPWERRQIEGAGTPLRSWEKAYWGVFVTAIALFLFSRLRAPPVPKEDPQVTCMTAAFRTCL